MREITVASALLVLGCLFATPPALSSFPTRAGAVWSPDCCGRPIEREEPKVPEAAARSGQTGWVIVSGVLDDRGWVTEPKVLAADPPGVFDTAALAAFDAWRYATPPTQAAGPREVRELLRFEHRRPAPEMPSESGGGGGGGGGYGY
jgi:TonB family protein